MATNLKGKNVLVLGLGLLGGGIATTQWLLDRGARVTVTDLKDEHTLAPSIRRIQDYLKKSSHDGDDYRLRSARLSWALGGHSNSLIDAADIIVVNPDVSVHNPFVRRALAKKKRVVNEGSLFYDEWKKKIVGITGTRGKTTTANWAHHFITSSVLAGNSTTKPFMSVPDNSSRYAVAVTETSSFILELFGLARRGPDVAVITNLYQDHLNRHGTMQKYAEAKANIFCHQRPSDSLVLNRDDAWTPWFLKRPVHGRVHFISMHELPGGADGIWYAGGKLWTHGKKQPVSVLDVEEFSARWGEHNLMNLMAAALAARLVGVTWKSIQGRIASLPQIPFRQEVVHHDRSVTVVNDTTATSPEGGIAALRRWGAVNCILITGGTDRKLDYRAWAAELPRFISPNNTIFLAGSATQKMKSALGERARGIRTYETLGAAWRAAKKRAGVFLSSVILFSPAAKSFELFANEFDRGTQFNALVHGQLK